MRDWTRRAFLKLISCGGASMYSGFGMQMPGSLVSKPLPGKEQFDPARWLHYTTTCRECPAGCGMRVMHMDGRATKAEAAEKHPVSGYGLCPRGQSAPQGQYDPDRLRFVLRREGNVLQKSGWLEALEAIGPALRERGGKLYVLSGVETGAAAQVLEDFSASLDGELLYYEPFSYDSLLSAHEQVFGLREIPLYRLDRAGMIVSFGVDFLDAWVSNVQFAGQYAVMKGVRGNQMGRFSYVGPLKTMTAANAEDFVQVAPSQMAAAAWAFLRLLREKSTIRGDVQGMDRQLENAATQALPPATLEQLNELADHFAQADGAVALVGPLGASDEGSKNAAVAAALINHGTGNIGRTVDFSRTHALGKVAPRKRVQQVLESLTAQDVVVLHNVNPVYGMPEATSFLQEAGLVVALDTMRTESAAMAHWVLPIDSPLESWGEYEPWTGVRCIQQPTMRRMYGTQSGMDVLIRLAEAAGRPLPRRAAGAEDFRSRLESGWQSAWTRSNDGLPYKDFRRNLLQQGWITEPAAQREVQAQSMPAQRPAELSTPVTGAEFELWSWGSILLHDGRGANRTWLQVAPHPVSYICWGSWLDIHPERAAVLGIETDDQVRIQGENGATAILPARVTEEVDASCAAVCFGQGHQALGSVARGVGVNAFGLIGGQGPFGPFGKIRVEPTGETQRAVYQSATREQHERDVLQWTSLEELAARPEETAEEIDMPLPAGYAPETDIYKGHEHARHRWAMVVDLHRCIGCGACAVACYAENNIAIYEPEDMLEENGRELSWIKIVPYLQEKGEGRLGWLPMLCQHCDEAPCEPVCPVFAAVHTEDGLNAQVYNRCIGTRYCSNNCPYKVRRFNWFNPKWRKPLEWQLNPDVTARCRGVMEKCTFCVQRIRRAEHQALIEGREIREDEIKPACLQTCPTGVFTFGDLRDENSAVSRMFRSEPRRYQLLRELNTKPAVLYLKRVQRERVPGQHPKEA